jgi:hypothetical protein
MKKVQIVASWLLLAAITPTATLGANPQLLNTSAPNVSTADPAILKKVILHYNSHRDIDAGFYRFLKASLAAEDFQYAEKALKNRDLRRLPIAAVSGNKVTFQGMGDSFTIERLPDGRIQVSAREFNFMTTEKNAMSDLVRQLKKPKKDLVSGIMNLLIPDAHAFIFEAADAIGSMGGFLYSYWEVVRDKVKDAYQNSEASPETMHKLNYLRAARDNVYSCQQSKSDWSDSWFQRSFKDREGTIRKIADHFDDRSKLNDPTIIEAFNDESSQIEKQVQITSEQVHRDCTGQEEKIAEGNPRFEISPNGDSKPIHISSEERNELCENLRKRLDCLAALRTTRSDYVNNYYPGASSDTQKSGEDAVPGTAKETSREASRAPAVVSATPAN